MDNLNFPENLSSNINVGLLRLEDELVKILKDKEYNKIKSFLDELLDEQKYGVCTYVIINYMDHITPESFKIILKECDFLIDSPILQDI